MTDAQLALMELMGIPDPPDLPARGHVLTHEGEPLEVRRARWAMLPLAYVAHHHARREER